MAKITDKTATAPTAVPAPQAAAVVGLSEADLGIGDATPAAALPQLAPRRGFYFTFHPERWCVLEGEVVPLLGHLTLQDGLCGVSATKPKRGERAKLLLNEAIKQRQERGWTVLPLAIEGPGTSYLRRPMPGVVLTRWETAHAGSSVVTSDVPGYVAWLRKLMAEGKIPRPQPYVLHALRSVRQAEVLRLRDLARSVPSAAVELEKAEGIVAAIDKAIADSAPTTPVDGAPVHDLTEDA